MFTTISDYPFSIILAFLNGGESITYEKIKVLGTTKCVMRKDIYNLFLTCKDVQYMIGSYIKHKKASLNVRFYGIRTHRVYTTLNPEEYFHSITDINAYDPERNALVYNERYPPLYTNITTLSLTPDIFTESLLKQISQYAPQLYKMSLESTGLTTDMLKHIPLGTIKDLNLSGNNFTNLDMLSFYHFDKLTLKNVTCEKPLPHMSVYRLELSHSNINDISMVKNLESLRCTNLEIFDNIRGLHCDNLSRLYVSNTHGNVEDDDDNTDYVDTPELFTDKVAEICSFIVSTNINKVTLSRLPISQVDINVLSSKYIESIYFESCSFYEGSISLCDMHSVHLEECVSLLEIRDLSRLDNITIEGCDSIETINRITDVAYCSVTECENLKQINCISNSGTDSGVYISECENLQTINTIHNCGRVGVTYQGDNLVIDRIQECRECILCKTPDNNITVNQSIDSLIVNIQTMSEENS